MVHIRFRPSSTLVAFAFLLLGLGSPLALRGQAELSVKVAVIDSDRIVAESGRGQEALEELKALQEQKVSEGKALQEEINDLRTRIDEGKLSLAPERLEELKKEYEDKVIAFQRFQDDADRELNKRRDETLGKIEREVLDIIDQYGRDNGYTLIFNKYRSGLVFASDAVDITDDIIARFDQSSSGGE